jgi:TRAP-type mannitol/chloroaromatic compound transport system substrate-binding protein
MAYSTARLAGMKDGEMTAERFEKLIKTVVDELGLKLRVFGVDHVQKKGGVWAASLSGQEPFEAEVSIDTHDHNTDELVKAEIRRQLEAHRKSSARQKNK